jgi:hypothetical protein
MVWRLQSKHGLEGILAREKKCIELMVSGTMIFYLESEMVIFDFTAQMDLVDNNGLKAKLLTVYVLCSIYS